MQQNYFNPYYPNAIPQQCPNAVSINIIAPQAYGAGAGVPNCAQGSYSLYGQNAIPNTYYPINYNNLVQPYQNNQYMTNPNGMYPQNMQLQNMQPQNMQQNMPQDTTSSQRGMTDGVNLLEKTTNETNSSSSTVQNEQNKENEKTKTKQIVPLTDDYVKSLENYLNSNNPKIRLIGAKDLLERFKEDENRKDNPSLMPLLNKALRDVSPSVRFLALTALQLDYAVGNDETVAILKEIQTQNQDKIGEDSILASEILLKMSAGQKVEVPMTQAEIEKQNQANNSQTNQGSK